MPAASLGSPSLGGHQRTSVKHWGSNQKVKQREEWERFLCYSHTVWTDNFQSSTTLWFARSQTVFSSVTNSMWCSKIPKCDLKAVISYSVFIYTSNPSLLQLLLPWTWSLFGLRSCCHSTKYTCPKVSFFLVHHDWLINNPTCAKYTLSTSKTIHFTFIWTSFQFSHIYL